MSLEEYSKKRFLIVDELDSFRFSTKKTLLELGLKLVDSANSAQKVITGFENINYDIVLCNYELGKGKNGQELLEELRYRKLLQFTGLFFIISAEVEKGNVMGTIENEPDGYLVKPVTPKELKERLLKALKMKDAMRQIDVAIDEGDYLSAISYCDRKIAEKDRYFIRCIKTKAWLLTKVGDFDQAKGVYESILKSNNFVWAEYGLSKIALKQKDFKRATELLKSIISKDPYQIEAMDLLAEIYKKQKNITEAKTIIQKAISLSPNALLRQKELADLCIENSQNDEALDAFRKMIKLSDQSIYAQPEQYFDFANFLADSSKADDDPEKNPYFKEAFELLDKGKKRFSTNTHITDQSQLVTANVYAIVGNTEQAQTIFDQVMEKNKDKNEQFDAKSLKLAAGTLSSLGKESEAEKYLELAADLADDDVDLLAGIYDQLNSKVSIDDRKQAANINKLGIKLYTDGDIQEAANKLRKALPLTPRHISLNLNLAQVLLKFHKATKEDSLLQEIKGYLNSARHTPKHHREFKRQQYLVKQFENRCS